MPNLTKSTGYHHHARTGPYCSHSKPSDFSNNAYNRSFRTTNGAPFSHAGYESILLCSGRSSSNRRRVILW